MSDVRQALVVDDHPTNRLLATTFLKRMGWTVYEAEDGESALKLAEQNAFWLILLDISMPGLSGEDTCGRLRGMQHGANTKIVAYTAHAFSEDLNRLLANGFDDVLVKPINRQRFEDLIARL